MRDLFSVALAGSAVIAAGAVAVASYLASAPAGPKPRPTPLPAEEVELVEAPNEGLQPKALSRRELARLSEPRATLPDGIGQLTALRLLEEGVLLAARAD